MNLFVVSYIILFFVYCFIGWVMETIYMRVTTKVWVNRGFLIGPICPIYGCGSFLLIFLLNKYSSDYFVLFISAIFICSILEYSTSYFLEKIFKARWWDYSHLKYNINGRICLETMIPFGVFGAAIVGFVNPYFVSILSKIPIIILYVISSILIILFLIDSCISFSVVTKIKGNLKFMEADNTREIKKKIKNILMNNVLYRRFIRAFPDLFSKILNLNIFGTLKSTLKKKSK